jgi:predicted Fe-Mo cluster-binding NifX family protein
MEGTETELQSAGRGRRLVAVPSVGEGGLQARRSSHFGKSPCFTLVELTQDEVGDVRTVPNERHSEGGCRAAAQLLAAEGASALVAGGIGARPLAVLNQAGIEVYFDKQRKTVAEAIAALAAGELRPIELDQTCSHHRGQEHEHTC